MASRRCLHETILNTVIGPHIDVDIICLVVNALSDTVHIE